MKGHVNPPLKTTSAGFLTWIFQTFKFFSTDFATLKLKLGHSSLETFATEMPKKPISFRTIFHFESWTIFMPQ
ncbi:hypothetical protein PK69_08190 [Xanthomonas phaseoli pv. phaseoli]|uniref:Uncharacterized protein n=1 Tax=Xanthomonas campestris pv. phaseoli TaxID=317013 RepID=A0AB34QHY2_XANCH|nr:hypothetical protein AC609_09740 [Xanthomonas phaseoli pv. phaseoli]AZU30095.1 hypothetical protein AC801_09555 [Xanthomonas sp. ISO98C4]AZU25739.1 hypothetical protein AC611_09745 [Xanthomonas phaseoli pv. phaseoli]AZU34507.1 hypothetical protein AC610_09735 [Xanthomonas phaseoli pv. phaseoli]KGT49327.1 hypothetical protein NZ02_20340 [Xanthomonas phaseoli pv. phaseoli]